MEEEGMWGGGRGRFYTYRYTVTTRMTSALMGSDESHFNVSVGSDGHSHKTGSTNHNFWRERRAEPVSNRGPSAYQPTALPLGQTGSHGRRWSKWLILHSHFRGVRDATVLHFIGFARFTATTGVICNNRRSNVAASCWIMKQKQQSAHSVTSSSVPWRSLSAGKLEILIAVAIFQRSSCNTFSQGRVGILSRCVALT